MNGSKKHTDHLVQAVIWLTVALALGACSRSHRSPQRTPTPPPAPITLNGLVSDGPVIGGTIHAFSAERALALFDGLEPGDDLGAALTSTLWLANVTRRDGDGDAFTLEVPGVNAGEAVFLVFNGADAEDEDFGDTPPRLETVVVLGGEGSARVANLSLHTTLIAQIVRAQLDPDGDGVPIDTAAIGAAIQAAELSVLAALGEDDDGEDLFDGESPLDTEDADVLHGASSVLGLHIRTIAALEGVELDEVVAALAADASDGDIDGMVGADFDAEFEELAGSIGEFLARDDDDDYAMLAVGPCSTSAVSLRRACAVDLVDDLLEGNAFCADISDDADRADCLADLEIEQEEEEEACDDVFEARLAVCESLGDAAHEPPFGEAFAADFVDPRLIGTPGIDPNPYLPLVQGAWWTYQGSFMDEGELVTETVTVTVTDAIKLIDGIPCLVVNDVVVSDAGAMEDTDDWFAQDVDGNVWYCGEISRDLELFEGDDPEEFELVAIEGSWKHGRDGAKAGMLIPAAPAVGDLIRQELLYGEAEDLIEIESITGTEAAGAVASCTGDCLVTLDFTPLEPDAEENKYYAPGVGMIVEVDLESGDRVELIDFNVP